MKKLKFEKYEKIYNFMHHKIINIPVSEFWYKNNK